MVVGISLIAALVFSIWLTAYNAWIWVFSAVIIVWLVVLVVFAFVTTFAIGLLRPKMNANQEAAVSAFVDKVERVTDYAGTPKIIVLFKVLRDLIWPREESFILKATKDSTSLHKDFIQLSKDFDS